MVACVAFRLIERDDRNRPQDYGAFLDLDLEESLFAQAQLTPYLGRHGDTPGRVHRNDASHARSSITDASAERQSAG